MSLVAPYCIAHAGRQEKLLYVRKREEPNVLKLKKYYHLQVNMIGLQRETLSMFCNSKIKFVMQYYIYCNWCIKVILKIQQKGEYIQVAAKLFEHLR